MLRYLRWLVSVVAATAVALTPPLAPTAPTSPSTRTPAAPAGITISGVDSHDGQIYQDGGLYYWVGTRYGCGWVWGDPAKQWCGFGVWSAPSLSGPWTYLRDLFDPNGASGTWKHEGWQQICRGDGCFNPRMIRRPDGAYVLWFGAGHDTRVWGANAFWALGCNGPAGPCGWQAGPPFGSTIKPALWICSTGGDHSVFVDPVDQGAYLICGHTGWTINIERLQPWYADGTGTGARNVSGAQYTEGAGMYRAADGTYVVTYSPNCAYCSGTPASYAVASSPYGPWQVPAGSENRRRISPHSCGGQTRTVVTLDGQPYQQIDTWYDAPNETNAATRLEPLIPTGAPWLGSVNGGVWTGPLKPFTCT